MVAVSVDKHDVMLSNASEQASTWSLTAVSSVKNELRTVIFFSLTGHQILILIKLWKQTQTFHKT